MQSVLPIFLIVMGLGMVAAATWLVGLWNNVITWVNLVIAAMVATSFFELLATVLNNNAPESTYLADFVSIWGLFIGTFVLLRVATELLSRHRVKFDIWTEMVGRSIMSILIAITLFAFASFTLHVAPLPIAGTWEIRFQPTPDASSFGIGADRAWMNFVKSASLGSFAEFRDSRLLPPYELSTTAQSREFDPTNEFIIRYRDRRRILSEQDNLQIASPNEK